LRASDNPIAIACLRLVTFFPLRPDFSLPFFISRISRSTALPAAGLYLRELEDFLEALFFEDEDFFAGEDFFAELFLAALFFLVAMARSSTQDGTRGTTKGLPYKPATPASETRTLTTV
jgi:hypothetical protein